MCTDRLHFPVYFSTFPKKRDLACTKTTVSFHWTFRGNPVTPIGPSACQSNGIRDSCERSLAGNRDGMD